MDCQSGELVEEERGTSSEEYDLSGRVIGNRNRFDRSDPSSKMYHYPFDDGVSRLEKPTYWEGFIPPFWKYGALIYTEVYTYDNNSRRSEHVMYRPDGAVQARTMVAFDKHGRIAEIKSYNADGTLGSWNVRKYDGRGNEVESAYYKENRKLAERELGGCSSLQKSVSTYEFDAAGNWVKHIVSRPFLKAGRAVLMPYSYGQRTITYY